MIAILHFPSDLKAAFPTLLNHNSTMNVEEATKKARARNSLMGLIRWVKYMQTTIATGEILSSERRKCGVGLMCEALLATAPFLLTNNEDCERAREKEKELLEDIIKAIQGSEHEDEEENVLD